MDKIVLLGYMGSGKSTIGKLLAKTINFKYKDLDKIIEKDLDLSINEIFKQKGELYFRKKEHQVLRELLQSDKRMIISLGGGTPCYANNMEMIRADKNVISIYLKASIGKLYNRLRTRKAARPLIAHFTDAELEEYIAKHLFERSYFYNMATHTIITEDKPNEVIVDEIKQLLI